VKGHEYSINFQLVNFDEEKKIVVSDIFVIEIHINHTDLDELYFTHFDECWIKKPDGQIDLIAITDLKSQMVSHFNESFEVKRNAIQRKIDFYEGKGIENLSEEELLKLKMHVETILTLIKNQRAYMAQKEQRHKQQSALLESQSQEVTIRNPSPSS